MCLAANDMNDWLSLTFMADAHQWETHGQSAVVNHKTT